MTDTISLSPDQIIASDAIMSWFSSRKNRTLTMGGYAGCGKTFLMGHVTNQMKSSRRLSIAFCCYTGRAALVLKNKLTQAGALSAGDYCGTIYSLIYKAIREPRGGVTWKRVPRLDADLIILDEASMVGDDVYRDLSSYGIPILAVGDHGQLPPVSGSLNLMENPQIRLEKIHRQAEGSPIIHVSMLARLEGRIPVGMYGPGVIKTSDRSLVSRIKDPKAGVVLCGRNTTRTRTNADLRRRTGMPQPGERIVCLRNDRNAGIYNGMLGDLVAIEDRCPLSGQRDLDGRLLCVKNCTYHYHGVVHFASDDVTWEGPMLKSQFGAATTIREDKNLGNKIYGQFDYGNALTVHKMQGSQMDAIVVVEECDWMKEDDQKRWLYTATTRSVSKLVVVGN